MILIIATIAAYYPILFNDFLYYWDDQWVAMNRYTEGGLNFNNFWAILSEFYHGQYAPLNEYLYLSIYSIFGYNPMAFHAASLLLHIGCVCLAYIIIIRIFKQTNRINFQNAPVIAFITALLFAIHPMNVESVAWISAAKVIVYTLFYLLATYSFLRYIEKKKTAFYFLTLLLFILSFGAKEQAVTFPVWLLMLYWMLGHSLKDRKIWIQVAPFFVLSFAFGYITMLSQAATGGGILSNAAIYPLWQRFILGCYSFVEYFIKCTIPYHLMYIYPFPMIIGEPLPTWMLLYPAMLFIVIATLSKYLKRMPFSVGLPFFLIHIAVALHIIPLSRFAVIADRYVYLASIGITFMIAWYVVRFLATKKGAVRKIAIGCFACVAIGLIAYSNIRSRDWKDTDSIKRELRELLKKRHDYVAPALEKLTDDDDDAIEDEAEEATGERADTKPYIENIYKSENSTIAILFIKLLNYEEIYFSVRCRNSNHVLRI